MNSLLILAISEMQPKTYKILAVDINKQKFHGLELKENEFFDSDGNPVWDLFAVTKGVSIVSTRGLDKVIGRAYIDSYYTKQKIKDYFESKLMLIDTFMKMNMQLQRNNDPSEDYGIFKLKNIRLTVPIYKDKKGVNYLRQYVEVPSRQMRKPPIKILNKDYRWINYWENIPQKLWEDKIKHWDRYLNSKDRDIYAIGYSMMFNKTRHRWVCGFHCL